MAIPAERAAAVAKAWFAALPDQRTMPSVMLELPGGRNAPGSDCFVTATRIAADSDDLVVHLDGSMELRFSGLEDVRPVSEADLWLAGFDVLDVSWDQGGARRGVRYRDGDARLVSGHLVGTDAPQPPPDAITWENPI